MACDGNGGMRREKGWEIDSMVREDGFYPAAWRSIGATTYGRASESNGGDVKTNFLAKQNDWFRRCVGVVPGDRRGLRIPETDDVAGRSANFGDFLSLYSHPLRPSTAAKSLLHALRDPPERSAPLLLFKIFPCN